MQLQPDLSGEEGRGSACANNGSGHSGLVMIGLNYRSAPIGVREKLAFSPQGMSPVLQQVMNCPHVQEAMLLSTCNRTELYAVVNTLRGWEALLVPLLASNCPATVKEIEGCLYTYTDEDVARHLFQVAAGLDSMVVGEVEIVHQVKQAAELASTYEAAGPILHRLADKALAASKQARTQTRIDQGSQSVASIAVSAAKRIFGDLSKLTIMVLGAGTTAELTLHYLVSKGVRKALVANRTPEHAERLAQLVGGEALSLENFAARLDEVDIVISCTAAPEPILTYAMLATAMQRRHGRALLVLDLAVPRNVEPAVASIANLCLINVDDLEQAATQNAQARQEEVGEAAEIVDEEAAKFGRWLLARKAVPTIVELQECFEEVRAAVAERLAAELENSENHHSQIIDKYTKLLMRRLLNAPIRGLNESTCSEDAEQRIDTVRKLFDLEHEGGNDS